MNNYYYGRGMNSSHRPTPEEPKKPKTQFKWPKLKLNLKPSKKSTGKRVLHWAIGILAIGFFVTWLLLGSFRFMLWRAPAFTGFPFGSRTYVVLFQNNYELRPTGGFISTYGVLRFSHGVYKGIEFQDVYGEIDEHDYVEPPLVLSTLLDGEGYQGHTFRDANYNPDFTLAKDDLIEFYNLAYPDERVDGVIAADFHFLEKFVGLYEPVIVDGYELTEQNLFETLSTVVSDIDRHNEEALANRKGITAPLVKQLISKSLLPWRIPAVLDLVETAFDEKHIIASFNRNRLEKAYMKRGWNGAMPESSAGDFLAVNDANYGGMKSNRYITHDVKYELDVSEGTDVLGNPVVTATTYVTLSHEGIWNIPLSGAYTGYLRTMVPLGADIIVGSDIIEETDSALVIGELVSLQPGESVTYIYSYELPEYVWQNGEYVLHLHKQPGTDADHYEVVVRVPQGMSFDAQGFDVRENVAFYSENLLVDTNLRFAILEDENPPRIVMHEITDFNEITLVFNEPLATDYAGDPLLYQVVDTDYTNPTATDPLIITNIRVDGAAVIISTEGMTIQPDERYSVTIQGLRDLNGNVIDPSPRTLTVIQRDDIEVPVDETEETSDTETLLSPDPETPTDG